MGGSSSAVWWRGVRVDPRTADMMTEAARLTPDLPTLTPSQGSYTTAVGASAGTHAGGGAIDLRASNLTPAQTVEAVRVMRSIGFAAWRRLESEGPWPEHIHGIAIGCPDLSPAAARQVEAYRDGRNGLANNGPDTGPQVGFITWEQYQAERDQDMPTLDEIRAAVRAEVRAELDRPIRRDASGVVTTVRANDGGRYAFFANTNAGRALAKTEVILEVLAGLPDVDADELAAKVAAAVERLDAEAVAEQLEVTVKGDTEA